MLRKRKKHLFFKVGLFLQVFFPFHISSKTRYNESGIIS